MTLSPYPKTAVGALVILAAAAALKLGLLPLTDAISVAMAGAAIMGIRISNQVEKALAHTEPPVTKESLKP